MTVYADNQCRLKQHQLYMLYCNSTKLKY